MDRTAYHFENEDQEREDVLRDQEDKIADLQRSLALVSSQLECEQQRNTDRNTFSNLMATSTPLASGYAPVSKSTNFTGLSTRVHTGSTMDSDILNNSKGYAKQSHPLAWRHIFGTNPDEDIGEYMQRFELYANGCAWSEDVKVASLVSTLKGRAMQLIRDLPAKPKWTELRDCLLTKWESTERLRVLRETFPQNERTRKETAQDYLQRLISLASRAFAHHPADLRTESVLATKRAGVRVTDTYEMNDSFGEVLQTNIDRPERSVPETITDEEILGSVAITSDAIDWVRTAISLTNTDDDGTYEEHELYHVLLTSAVAKGDTQTPRGQCFFCKKPGHRWMRCFRLREILTKNGMKPMSDRPNYRPPWTSKPTETTPRTSTNAEKGKEPKKSGNE